MKRYELFSISLIFIIYNACILAPLNPGFNYMIYNHFSGLYWQGINPYKASGNLNATETYKNSSYLDYSGGQLTIYNVLYYLQHQIKGEPFQRINAFRVYSFFILCLFILCLFLLNRRNEIDHFEYFSCTVLVFLPALWVLLFFRGFEDKLLFCFSPILILTLWRKNFCLSGFICGVLGGINGIPLFYLPLLWIALSQHTADSLTRKKGLFLVTFLFICGFSLAMLPFFPDSLLGWQRRSAREGVMPFWFSIWNLFPEIYFRNLNKIMMGLGVILVYLGMVKNKFNLKTSLVLTTSVFLFFSNNQAVERVIPLVLLFPLIFVTPYSRVAYLIVAVIFLGIGYDEFNRVNPEKIKWMSFLVSSPITFGYLLLCFEIIWIRYFKSEPHTCSG